MMEKREKGIKQVNQKLGEEVFVKAHKSNQEDFTRNRTLNFAVVFMLILRKSVKSIQLTLNELFMNGYIGKVTSASAYTQARKKLKHTAFIELNEDILGIYYEDDAIKRWKGYRLLGADSSKIILPPTADIEKEYGKVAVNNPQMKGSYVCGLFECYYDVLNHMAVKSCLTSGLRSEISIAKELLEGLQEEDIVIYDRGYASYEFLAHLEQKRQHFVIRCPRHFFKGVTAPLFLRKGPWSQVVKIKAPEGKREQIKASGLPEEIEIRLVSVVLNTGEVEVLATSLKDLEITREEWKELYGLRWGVEGFYEVVKNRLYLENFTGKTAESVKQDFWSTIFISNCETLMTEEADEELNESIVEVAYEKKVNKAVSFNVIKNMAFEIFLNATDMEAASRKMALLFKTTPVVVRPDRKFGRKRSIRRSYHYVKRVAKVVF
jgi:hypothetical protein